MNIKNQFGPLPGTRRLALIRLALGLLALLPSNSNAALGPAVSIVAPTNNATFPANSNIAITANAFETNSAISAVYFVQGANTVFGSSYSGPPFTFTWNSAPPGTYAVKAYALDSQSYGTWSDVITITVLAPTNTTDIPRTRKTPPPPPPAPATYALTVNNGTGSGTYTAGTVVSLNANAAPAGQVFDQWTGAAVVNSLATSTTLSMPSAATTVTANFKALPAPPTGPTNAILFVTQIPIGFDYTTIGSVFANHRPTEDSVGRGGDLYIRYADGTVNNLTAAAGFGVATGFQGGAGIAVRDPSVGWSGQKALFSMIVGSPTTQYAVSTATWQLYEITNFGQGQNPVITKVPNQPANYNNIAPCYGTDGRILFITDRPKDGLPQLYPQLDEYELAPAVSGLWSLDPATGDLFNLDHTPSGVFSPSVDSFGRVVFVRWDHLQRDQEADIDTDALAQGQPPTYGTFNYSDESAGAAVLVGNRTEVFPEPRTQLGNANGHVFNIFFPWMIQEDGTEEETINHVGRHELYGYLTPSFRDDPNLVYFYNPGARFNTTYVNNFLQMKEDPRNPGRYFGTDASEFSTHASGQIVALNAPQGLDADQITLDYITDPVTKQATSTPTAAHSGHFREPLPLSDGTLVAVHAIGTDVETQRGIGSDYAFRLKTLWRPATYWVPYQTLTPGFTKSVTFYSNGGLVHYSGPLWELNPVEVRARPIPHGAKTPLGQLEKQIFADEGVDLAAFKGFLQTNGLSLIVSRNVTTRDHADRQQPFNLRVAGTTNQTLGAAGYVYDIAFLQLMQGDQIRGYGIWNSNSIPRPGRRVLAQPMHDPSAVTNNPANPTGPAGSVQLGADGSMAAFVPARRAMTWQLTDPSGTPTVRERYWLTFQPGEIRSCTSCHGVNTHDQAGNPPPTNPPAALRTLLKAWKAQQQTGP